MADITYTPNYVAPLYRDNVDLVSAEGPNGFNYQFSQLRAEFDQLTQVVTQINAALIAVGQKPSVQLTLTLAPTMASTALFGWAQHPGFVDKPSANAAGQPQVGAEGVMPVVLPDQVTLVSFRVAGRNAGQGNLRIMFQRQTIVADNSNPASIVTVAGVGDPFDSTILAPTDPNLVKVDTTRFKYFIFAQLSGAVNTDIVQLNGFQITYKTPAS